MKKLFFSIVCCLSLICVSTIISSSDIKAVSTSFVGHSDGLSDAEISDSIRNSKNTGLTQTLITFIVHGLDGNAANWSNTMGTKYGIDSVSVSADFGYNPNSIIECLRRKTNGTVFLATASGSDAFTLSKLTVVGNIYESEDVSKIDDDEKGKHIIVIFEASSVATRGLHDDIYSELSNVINKITYDIKSINSWVPIKINLVGQSRGGIINMMYSNQYPYNVDGLFSLGTPYNGSTLGALIEIFELNMFNSDGGEQILSTKDSDNPLKDEWKEMHAENENVNINFHAIAGYIDTALLMKLILDAYNDPFYNAQKDKFAIIYNIVNILEQSYINSHNKYDISNLDDEGEYIYNAVLLILLHVSLLFGGDLEIRNILNSLFKDLYYSMEIDSLIIKNDIFVNSSSQLAEGFDIDSQGNPICINRFEKTFTMDNCEFGDVSIDDVAIIHNLESRDLELINYILMNINLDGDSISSINTCYLPNNKLGLMSLELHPNLTSINIPNNVYGISHIFSNLSEKNILPKYHLVQILNILRMEHLMVLIILLLLM